MGFGVWGLGFGVNEGADDKFHFHAEHSKTVCDLVNFIGDGSVGIEKPTRIVFDTDTNSCIFVVGILIVTTVWDRGVGTKLN